MNPASSGVGAGVLCALGVRHVSDQDVLVSENISRWSSHCVAARCREVTERARRGAEARGGLNLPLVAFVWHVNHKANAKFGVARVQQLHLQHTQKVYRDLGVLRWERREIRGERPNPYHGNFVFPDGVPKHVHIAMVGLIAHHARVVAPDAPSDNTSQAPESGGVKD